MLVLLWLSVFLNYIDRSNLSIPAPLLKGELGLSASQLGVLLSAFFWTYACLQIPAGWLVDRLEVKWVFAGGLVNSDPLSQNNSFGVPLFCRISTRHARRSLTR